MVIGSADLNARFGESLKNATHVDIATAWATGGRHLQALAGATKRTSRPVEVRAIVGISGRATRPDALEELRKITGDHLRIIKSGNQLFHPKLYVFRSCERGVVEQCAWIGSANFTNQGFGGHSGSNEEIMLEVGPGPAADALGTWFEQRWEDSRMDRSVAEIISQYKEDWERNPPQRDVRRMASGSVSQRIDFLDDAHRPVNFEGYVRALRKCERELRDEAWGVFGDTRSYMSAIGGRRAVVLGEDTWSQLDPELHVRLMGGTRGSDSDWWGLLGRVRASHWSVVESQQNVIQDILREVDGAGDSAFPDIAVAALKELTSFKHIGPGNATLLLTLARSDRLLSVNDESTKGLAALSGMSPSTLGRPKNYRKLLEWLDTQPWYSTPCPDGDDAARIWRFRAALVDAFVYKFK